MFFLQLQVWSLWLLQEASVGWDVSSVWDLVNIDDAYPEALPVLVRHLGRPYPAVIRDGMIYGLGIYNMKGALVCYTHALGALQKAGVKLDGDIILAAVVGEIGLADGPE